MLLSNIIILIWKQDVKTPLDDYVNRPDPNYKWRALTEYSLEGCSLYVLNMTSQQWLTCK